MIKSEERESYIIHIEDTRYSIFERINPRLKNHCCISIFFNILFYYCGFTVVNEESHE